MSPSDIAARLGKFAAATLYEAIGRTGGMTPAIRPVTTHEHMAGVAYTVRILGAETAAVLRAVAEAPPGSVLVIDTGSVGIAPVWGGTSSLAGRLRGLAGCVTNGCVRDTAGIRESGLPVYAAGVCVIGTLKNHPGWHNVPVTVGGVCVMPGDYVIGDADGVVVVPAATGEAAIALAAAQQEKEEARDARIRAGESITRVVGLE